MTALQICAQQAADPQAPGAQSGAYQRSLALARDAVAVLPNDVGLMRALAGVHFRWGRFREAIASLQDVLRVDPGNPRALFELADCHARLEEYPAAIDGYRKVVSSNSPELNLAARRSIADLHFKHERFVEAVAELRALLASDDNQPDLCFQLGRALSAQAMQLRAGATGQAEAARLDAEAAAVLEKAARLDPSNAQSHYVLASIHRRQGKVEAAQQDLERFRAVRTKTPALDPAKAERSDQNFESRTAVQIARAFFQSGDLQRAAKLAQHAIQIDPTFTEAMAYQAWILWQTERIPEAVDLYERLLAREPQNADALWNLGNLRLKKEQLDSGAALILRAAQVRRPFPDAWELLANLAIHKGVFAEKAAEFARNALRQRPSRENYLTLAELYFDAGRTKECMDVITEALRRYPGDPELEQAHQGMSGAK